MAGPRRLVARFLAAALLASATACARPPSDDTPAGALQLFLAAMDAGNDNAGELERAYELMARESKRRLSKRAEMASALAGRRFEPWEMIAEGRFRLRFRPRARDGLVERIDGDRAIVTVRGEGRDEVAEVPLVREDEHWRVYLDIPSIDRGTSPPAPATDGTD